MCARARRASEKNLLGISIYIYIYMTYTVKNEIDSLSLFLETLKGFAACCCCCCANISLSFSISLFLPTNTSPRPRAAMPRLAYQRYVLLRQADHRAARILHYYVLPCWVDDCFRTRTRGQRAPAAHRPLPRRRSTTFVYPFMIKYVAYSSLDNNEI